ncbi:MAG: hypothetical protein K9N55_12370 [Phycisphaerae bacterium]|nr:hypothetical protein [Phycisphaerae bacterium]
MKKHSINPRAVLVYLVLMGVLLACPLAVLGQQPGKSPVKVFILAGQSNMQGQGAVNGNKGTLQSLVANDTEGLYAYLGDKEGHWTVRDDVWITYERDASNIRFGGLAPGYGVDDSRLGPELGFGHVVGDYYDTQVLLIKTCWGGKSLAVDFRPPSSGGTVGFYYREMLRLVDKALANLGTYFPDYEGQGYELAGFFWHQGWNDRVTDAYNNEYEVNMANFIRDVRKDLGIRRLPFVIATTGMTGLEETNPRALSLMEAQLAVARYPEFEGNVMSVDTRPFWRPTNESPSDQGYHWNSNGITYLEIGLASGEAMKELVLPRGSGTILRQWWHDTGASLADLMSHADYPNHPDGRDELTSFETPADRADREGVQLQGYLYAPKPGDYTFWIDCHQEAQLWLSPDANMASAALIAGTASERQSVPISLEAGVPYYIEALYTVGPDADRLAVTWEGPNVPHAVIEGQYLLPWTGAGPPWLTIENGEPNDIGMMFAVLGGDIVVQGSELPHVLLFWGETDGSVTQETWEHVEDLGIQAGAFDIQIDDLIPATTYFFRTFCSNADGQDWADASTEFTTLSAVATVEHLDVTNLLSTSVTLNGRVNYLGAEAPVVTVYWGITDGQTDPEAWEYSQDLGVQTDLFSVDLTGMAESRRHFYRFHCVNSFGESWADSSEAVQLMRSGSR